VFLNGDFANSYKAFDKLEGDEVAWSQTRIDDSVMGSSMKMALLNTEIQLLRTLRHKNIQKLFASWIDEDKKTVNIITEFCISGSLRQYVSFHYCCSSANCAFLLVLLWGVLIKRCLILLRIKALYLQIGTL
jgi:serine/threonine protein kinase